MARNKDSKAHMHVITHMLMLLTGAAVVMLEVSPIVLDLLLSHQ
jgi:hypothetical protein